MIAGVDGYNEKWIAAIEHRGRICVQPINALSEPTENHRMTRMVIDIPIGLLEFGTRKADAEARAI